MGHVTHEKCTTRVRNGAELGVVPLARVRTATTDDHVGLEELHTLLQLLVVDQTGLGVDLNVRRTLSTPTPYGRDWK